MSREINVAGVMDDIASAITTAAIVPIVYPYPAEAISTPCAIVGYPETIEFDATFRRGSDKATIPVWLVAGRVDAKGSRDVISAFITGTGKAKATLDAITTTHIQTARCTDCKIENMDVGGVPYVTAKLDVEVYT